MSLPYENRCRYKGCRLYFLSATDVIKHIEAVHLAEWEATSNLFPAQIDEASVVEAMPDYTRTRNFVNAKFQFGMNLIPTPTYLKAYIGYWQYCQTKYDSYIDDAEVSSEIAVPMSAVLKFTLRDSNDTLPPMGLTLNPTIDSYSFKFLPLVSGSDTSEDAEVETKAEQPSLLSLVTHLDKQLGPSKSQGNESIDEPTGKQKKAQTEISSTPRKRKIPLENSNLNKCKHSKEIKRSPNLAECDPELLKLPNYYTKEFILQSLREVMRMRNKNGGEDEKPFICPVPGCIKAYKNPNGIRYHANTAHKGPIKRNCDICGKICRTPQGLSSHLAKHIKKENLEQNRKFANIPRKISKTKKGMFKEIF